MLEANEVLSLLDNMNIDIDSPFLSIGGGSSAIQRARSVYNDNFDANMESDDDLENKDMHDDGDKEDKEDDDDDKEELGIESDPTDEKLLISQDGNDYVASSKVDDYRYRPALYISTSLYDWTVLSVKERISGKTDQKMCFQILPPHGQRNFHAVKLIPSRTDVYLLNFIGGSLP
jgi:hypothetical protein